MNVFKDRQMLRLLTAARDDAVEEYLSLCAAADYAEERQEARLAGGLRRVAEGRRRPHFHGLYLAWVWCRVGEPRSQVPPAAFRSLTGRYSRGRLWCGKNMVGYAKYTHAVLALCEALAPAGGPP